MESLEGIIRSVYEPEFVRYSMSKLDKKCMENFDSHYDYNTIIEPMFMLLDKDIKENKRHEKSKKYLRSEEY